MARKEINIDEVVELIIEGLSYRAIAERIGVPLMTLHDYISRNDVHSARAQTALAISAQTFDDKAEQILIDAERDSIEIQRAKELSQYYRWKAAKRNPRKYGERLDINPDNGGIKFNITVSNDTEKSIIDGMIDKANNKS